MTTEIHGRPRAHVIKYAIVLALLVLACLFGLHTLMAGEREQQVTLAVAFRLTDSEDYPLPNLPVRVAFAGSDWQSADAGHRFTTDAAGETRFTGMATIDKRWELEGYFVRILPHRVDHLLIATEFERVVPVGGKDTHFHWLLVSHVICSPGNGSCSGGYIDEVYAKGNQGRYDRRLDLNGLGTDPDSQALAAAGLGFRLTDWLLTRDDSDPSGPRWALQLGYKTLTASPTAGLAAAAEAGDADRIAALLAAGANVNGKPSYGPSALLVAARSNAVAVVRALLAAGADVNARAERRDNGYTPLIAAAALGHLETVQALLAAGAAVNAGADAIGMADDTERGSTGLLVAAEHGHLAVVQALLAAGADPNARKWNDFTPLIVGSNSLPVVQALLAAGADANGTDKQGHTAMGWAKRAGHEDVVALLRQHGGHE